MNRTIAAVILLALTVIIATVSFVYIDNACNLLVSGIDNVSEKALTQNAEEVNRLTVLLNTKWEKEKIFIKILLGQKESSNLQNLFESADYYAKTQDFEALNLTLTELKAELCRIKESYEPDLQTTL